MWGKEGAQEGGKGKEGAHEGREAERKGKGDEGVYQDGLWIYIQVGERREMIQRGQVLMRGNGEDKGGGRCKEEGQRRGGGLCKKRRGSLKTSQLWAGVQYCTCRLGSRRPNYAGLTCSDSAMPG